MSHYTLTVVVPKDETTRLHDYLKDVLEPYSESLKVPEYRSYHERDDWPWEYFEKEEKRQLTANEVRDLSLARWGDDDSERYYVDEQGRLYNLQTYNPKSKWDWWTIGGRWRGYWKVKPNMPYVQGDDTTFGGGASDSKEGFGDIVAQGDIDWEGTLEAKQREAREAWREAPPEHRGFMFASDAKTEDEYAATITYPATFALIDTDGEWHERGNMGWWGIVTDEREQEDWNNQYVRYVGSLHYEDFLVLLDCHI